MHSLTDMTWRAAIGPTASLHMLRPALVRQNLIISRLSKGPSWTQRHALPGIVPPSSKMKEKLVDVPFFTQPEAATNTHLHAHVGHISPSQGGSSWWALCMRCDFGRRNASELDVAFGHLQESTKKGKAATEDPLDACPGTKHGHYPNNCPSHGQSSL